MDAATSDMTEEDHAFLELVATIGEDLIDNGYTPADDGEDDTTIHDYCVLFTHWEEDTPSLYLCRHSSEARTVLITAYDFELKEILVHSLEDWERCSELLTEERGLPLESRPEEEGIAKAGYTYGPNYELVRPSGEGLV
jgi:hypothetical protein